MENNILNSAVLLLPGGAPDQMIYVLKLRLKKILKNYQDTIIGYSKGAMVQLNMYHITPGRDYEEFKYCSGLGVFEDFMIEVHYLGNNGKKTID